ncbi:sugar ABC transporter substrate-binding protein, partial [Streptococcus pyogenes]
MPENGWTLEDLYAISKQVTKDTDGDGVVDQYGLAGYGWQQILAAYGIQLFDEYGNQSYFNTKETKIALSMFSRLNALKGN